MNSLLASLGLSLRSLSSPVYGGGVSGADGGGGCKIVVRTPIAPSGALPQQAGEEAERPF